MTKRVLFFLAIGLAFVFALAPASRATASPPAQSPDCAALAGAETVQNATALAACERGTGAPSGFPARPSVPSALLYDNGPYINAPGGGPSGADGSVLQTSLGLNTLGFGQAVSSGFRIADNFTITDAGGWQIDSMTFYAYQTGSTTTSTINNVNLRIWDGVPGAAGSTVVFGDTTTNRLSNSVWDNAYRYSDTTVGTTRPVMANTATVNTTLSPGTYWVDWQSGGTLSSGPWAPPITINGQTTTGDGLQYDPTANTWAPANDSGTLTQQGFPFIIEGTVIQASPTATATMEPTATVPPTSIELGELGGGSASTPYTGWLLGLLGLTLLGAGLVARRR